MSLRYESASKPLHSSGRDRPPLNTLSCPRPQEAQEQTRLALERDAKELHRRQAEDVEEGKRLLARSKEALLFAVKTGDAIKFGRILAPRLTIPATSDFTLRASGRPHAHPAYLPPRSAL